MPFEASDVFLVGQHLAQAGLSIYGIAVSYVAITGLLKYEEATKKLAEWSKEVDRQLQQTRSTQTAGFVAVLSSLIVSLGLAVFHTSLSRMLRIVIPTVALGVVLLTKQHMKKFWAPKDGKTVQAVPLPKMEEYNISAKKTQDLLKVLEYLEYSWFGEALLNTLI